ncbi:hypothetical protein V4C53_11715 [Paraburkholderia azotifigens]|uniref:hypothetical protein n=1 Tax=Paraburkholderia azotifigens TaxID=2057004 RepID=UPI0031761811
MDRYWEANAIATAPPVPGSTAGGYPTDGNPVMATPPTTPGAWWYHAITEELRNAIVKLGGTPDFTHVDQLANAIVASISSAISGVTTSLAKVAYSGSYADLKNVPVLAKVATSGNYSDLSNRPDLSVYATTAALNSTSQTLQGEIDGKQAAGSYVTGIDHGFSVYWDGMHPGLLVDNQDQGNLYCADWYKPMTVGAIGNQVLIEQGETGQLGSLSAGVHCMGQTLPGTWMSCGGGQTSGNNWYAWIRVA